MARARATAASCVLFDRSFTVDFLRVIFEAGAPLPGANAQIAEQVAAFRAKLQENGWAELWSKIAAVQHGLFGVQTDRMLIEENAFRPEYRATWAAVVKVKIGSCRDYMQPGVSRESEFIGQV